MKAAIRFVMLAGMVIALSACAQLNTAATFTATDLMNAIAIDQAGAMNANPAISGPATEKLSCDQWILANLQTIQMQLSAAPVTGFFSGTSAATQAADNILNAVGPAGRAQFEIACGPYDLHITADVALVGLLKLP